jgi:hypothetical protein
MRSFTYHRALVTIVRRANGVALCALAVVACTVALLARRRDAAPLAEELGAARVAAAADPLAGGRQPARGAALDAYVVFQLTDCDGNLRVLDLLQRHGVRDRITLAGLAFVGSHAELERARSRLPLRARSVPIRRATRASIDLLAGIGHRSTPILVVLDAERRVRYVTGAPRSPRAYVGLARVLASLEAADVP